MVLTVDSIGIAGRKYRNCMQTTECMKIHTYDGCKYGYSYIKS